MHLYGTIHRYAHLRAAFLTASLAIIFLASPVSAATLRLSPASASARVGESVTILVYVSSADQPMNAASATITFPSDLVEVRAVSKASSILSYWTTEPTFSNGSGSVSFEGVAFNPGFTGASGRIMSITLRALAPGVATLSFAAPSVLANDGLATNILTGSTGATIAIGGAPVKEVEVPVVQPSAPPATVAGKAVRITSPTHPIQDVWYSAQRGTFTWINPGDTSSVRILYDQQSSSQPTIVYSPPIASKEIDLLEGTGYVHVQARTSEGWSLATHYIVRVDATPPSPVQVSFPMGTISDSRLFPVMFESSDALSGIDRYDILVDEKIVATAQPDEAGKLFYVPIRRSGTLSIVAVDRAGNSTASPLESITFTGRASPVTSEHITQILLVILIALASANLYALLRRKQRGSSRLFGT